MNQRPQSNIKSTVIPNVPQTSQMNNQQRNNSNMVANDDGWVLVPTQNESDLWKSIFRVNKKHVNWWTDQ